MKTSPWLLLASICLLTAPPFSTTAQERQDLAPGCFADCADGLAPKVDFGPKAGSPAPAFAVWRANGADNDPGAITDRYTRLSLSDLLDGRPMILAFGSYT